MSTSKKVGLRVLSGLVLGALSAMVSSQELVIGEERIEPGVLMIFEGAIKDEIRPSSQHLPLSRTDVHIEARANWDDRPNMSLPAGTPAGGFVPYLIVTAEIRNENTNEVVKVSLTPHINLIDNFHYARNVALPGAKDDPYRVTFWVSAPTASILATHKD